MANQIRKHNFQSDIWSEIQQGRTAQRQFAFNWFRPLATIRIGCQWVQRSQPALWNTRSGLLRSQLWTISRRRKTCGWVGTRSSTVVQQWTDSWQLGQRITWERAYSIGYGKWTLVQYGTAERTAFDSWTVYNETWVEETADCGCGCSSKDRRSLRVWVKHLCVVSSARVWLWQSEGTFWDL